MAAAFRILIGYDGSEWARSAIYDLRRAGIPAGVEAVVMTAADVVPHLPVPSPEATRGGVAYKRPRLRSAEMLARAALDEARSTALEGTQLVRSEFPDWQVRADVVDDYAPYRALVLKADKWPADLVVVGSHGRSAVGRAVLGSVSQQVLGNATCSVRVARFHKDAGGIAVGPVRLLIGVDGSPDSEAAADVVAARSWPKGSQAHVVVVIDPRRSMASLYGPPFGVSSPAIATKRDDRPQAASVAEGVARQLREAGLEAAPVILDGDPKHVLLREAERTKADCIFVGARGHGRFERFLLGSVSSAVAARASCSVEVVRPRVLIGST